MKKFAKISLVAALAVAGLSSTVSAASLAEAAKSVDVFGYVNIRYNDATNDAGVHSASTVHKPVIGATGKFNDDWAFTTASAYLTGDASNGAAPYNPFLMVYNYFTFTGVKDTAINIGRFGLTSPLTVSYDPGTGTSEGNGIQATSKVGPVNIDAGYWVSQTLGANDLGAGFAGTAYDGGERQVWLGLSTKVANVALDAWYLDMEDSFDTWSVGASTSLDFDGVTIKPAARYSSSDIEGSSMDNSVAWGKLNVAAGIISADLQYGSSDKQGGWVANDTDAKANLKLWQIGLNGAADADIAIGKLHAQVTPQIKLTVAYADLEVANVDTDETLGQISYSPSSNFNIYLRYSAVDYAGATVDKEVGRLNMLWLF